MAIDGCDLAFKAVPVGFMLKQEIEARGYTQSVFAKEMCINPRVLRALLSGKKPISTDIAVKLEEVLGIPAQLWMDMQKRYELTLEKQLRRQMCAKAKGASAGR